MTTTDVVVLIQAEPHEMPALVDRCHRSLSREYLA
jgi:hypothetical protein